MNPKERFIPKEKIEFATHEDVDGILEVQESVLLANKDLEQDPGKSGFLATKIDRETVEDAIQHNGSETFLIIAKNEVKEVVGYFLAYDLNKWLQLHPNWVKETGIDPETIENNRVIYGKHVASNRTVRGIGRKLDEALFSLAKEKGYTLYVGEICEGPIKNEKSINVHTTEFDVKKVSEYKDGGYTFGVYVKEL